MHFTLDAVMLICSNAFARFRNSPVLTRTQLLIYNIKNVINEQFLFTLKHNKRLFGKCLEKAPLKCVQCMKNVKFSTLLRACTIQLEKIHNNMNKVSFMLQTIAFV